MAVGFREYITTTLAARAAYHCEEASGNLIDDGSVPNNLTVAGTPVYAVADSVTYESGKAITFDGSTDYFADGSGVDPDNGATGTIIVFYRIPIGQVGGIAYGMGNTGGGTALFVRPDNNRFTLSIQSTAGNRNLMKFENTSHDDGNWHLACLVQPGGTVGVDLYLDSVKTAWTTEVLTGGGTLDDWFDDIVSASDQYSVGASPDSSHVQLFQGDMSAVAITRTVMTQTTVDELWALTTTPAGVTATTRHTGRRVYNDAL